MTLHDVTNSLPDELRLQLLQGEIVYYFGFMDQAGEGDEGRMWMVISNRRVMYDASTYTGVACKRTSGSIPIEKVSYVAVSTGEDVGGCGCWPKKFYLLTVGSSGGKIQIAVPTQALAKELEKTVSELLGGGGR